MADFIDLTGQKYGRLTVIKRVQDYISPNGNHYLKWLCRCDCGNEKTVFGCSLRSGDTKSCGCYSKEIQGKRNKKYNSWELFMTTNKAVGTDNKGLKFTIDIEDWVKCKDYSWFVDKDGYVYVKTSISGKYTQLHRFLTNPTDDMQVDHINGDTLNNCKSNLRIVTAQQNAMNHKKYSNNSSGCPGVSWDKQTKKWTASIGYKGKNIYLGCYTNIEEAVKARQEAEKKYFGEYTRGVV